MARRRALKVSGLKIFSDEWCTEQSVIKSVAVRYFRELFTSDLGEYEPYGITGLFPPVDMHTLGNGLSLIWPHVRMNIQWKVGNGLHVKFWHGSWIRDVGPLIRFVPPTAVQSLGCPSVANMASAHGEWHWDVLQSLLPRSVLLHIQAMKALQPRWSLYYYVAFVGMRRRNWIVRLNLIPREYNMIVDSLAKLASPDNFETISYSSPPHSLRPLLLTDVVT
ncbi:hypothetical protein V6N13_134166 [Hibiscus sabdariffa]